MSLLLRDVCRGSVSFWILWYRSSVLSIPFAGDLLNPKVYTALMKVIRLANYPRVSGCLATVLVKISFVCYRLVAAVVALWSNVLAPSRDFHPTPFLEAPDLVSLASKH